MKHNTGAVALLIGMLSLTACSGTAANSASETASTAISVDTPAPSTNSVSPATVTTVPASPASTSSTSSGQAFSLQDQQSANHQAYRSNLVESSRIARHSGFDRLVVQYRGTDALSYAAAYISDPVEEGSGKPLKVSGQSFLQLNIGGVTYPTDATTEAQVAPAGLGGATVIQGAHVSLPFEGMHQVVIGVDKQRPYRVFTLTSPTRLVVDIATD